MTALEMIPLYIKGHALEGNFGEFEEKIFNALFEGKKIDDKVIRVIESYIDERFDARVCEGRMFASLDRTSAYSEIYHHLNRVAENYDKDAFAKDPDSARMKCLNALESNNQISAMFGYDAKDAFNLKTSLDCISGQLMASEITEEFGEDQNVYGMHGTSVQTPEDVEARNKLNKVIKEFSLSKYGARLLDCVGHFEHVLHDYAKSKPNPSNGAITGVEFGADLMKIFPEEIAVGYNNPYLKTLFLLDYVEESVLQEKIEIEDTAGRGDFILYIDLSSSTKDESSHLKTPVGTMRILDLEFALAISMAKIMKEAKRNMIAVGFTSNTTQIASSEDGWTFFFQRMFNAWAYAHGGTKIDNVILNYLYRCKDAKTPPDAILLTDMEQPTLRTDLIGSVKSGLGANGVGDMHALVIAPTPKRMKVAQEVCKVLEPYLASIKASSTYEDFIEVAKKGI